MHQYYDALLWCIITVMHYCYNASTLWCIKHLMCQCNLLWYNVLLVWCVEMQCAEWLMHGMMRWDAVWWLGDAQYDAVCDGWVMHVWCTSGLMCYVNEWMNEWMNERMNERRNELMVTNERVGNVEWPCVFYCILSVSAICLCIFSWLFDVTNKHDYTIWTSVCR